MISVDLIVFDGKSIEWLATPNKQSQRYLQ